jgi:flagellar biosynthesis/type III secretory pathway chaperone
MDTAILAQLVHRKRECLVQLAGLVRRQQTLIEAEEMTHLLDVLAAKQRLLHELEKIERALDPFRGQQPAERRWASPDDRQRCATELDDCRRLLAEIVAQERLCESDLSRRRDQAAEQLQGSHRARDARRAYTAGDGPSINQMDLSM